MAKSPFASARISEHKFDPARRGRLLSRERHRRLPPLTILRRLGLKRGDVFVDIGCGTGFFSLPAAQLVGPRGRVIGLDISPVMLADLAAEAERRGLGNLVPVRSTESGRGLPRGASLYFLGNVFHELDDRAAYLDLLARRAGPGSRLAILDYHRRKTEHGPPLRHRVSASAARRMVRAAGFRRLETLAANDEEYMIVARGPERRKEKT